MARSRSYIATPPGATIREQLKYRGMSQKEFAVRMDMSEKHISRLINGEVQLTPEVSIRLEIVLGVPARFWNNLEAIYREKLLKVQMENLMEADEKIVNNLPYNEMVQFEWIPNTSNIKEKVAHLRKYFEVVELGLLSNPRITRVACKGLSVEDKSDMAFLSWVQKAKIYARTIAAEPFDLKKLEESLDIIVKKLCVDVGGSVTAIQKILADCGVVLVCLPKLSDSKLMGATIVDGNKIIIALIEEIGTIREFGTSLFHELAHIVLGHIVKEERITEQDEKNADDWARNKLELVEKIGVKS